MSNRGIAGATLPVTLILATIALVVAACGGAPGPSSPPSASAGPIITPNPHLADPASVDEVIRKLNSGGLRITPNTASTGPGAEPVKRVNATYADWPLVVTQFSSAEALHATTKFDPSKPPRLDESPYIIAGLNLLIEFGPHSKNDRTPAPPSEAKIAAAMALVTALDPLLGPLAQRATMPLDLPGGTAAPSARATPAPSAAP